jgi:protein-S-isoprenylcysteine O-methyltransferase Ste14
MPLSRFLESLPPLPRRVFVAVWGATFIALLFGLMPMWAADLNHQLGWPEVTSGPGQVVGVGLFVAGVGVALHCSNLFARLGRGTPIPIDPPRELVVAGLYRLTRNPIYVAQVSVLASYFLYSGEVALLVYAAIWAALVQGFVVWVEEPGLKRRFGESYLRYMREVPRWIGIPKRRRPA